MSHTLRSQTEENLCIDDNTSSEKRGDSSRCKSHEKHSRSRIVKNSSDKSTSENIPENKNMSHTYSLRPRTKKNSVNDDCTSSERREENLSRFKTHEKHCRSRKVENSSDKSTSENGTVKPKNKSGIVKKPRKKSTKDNKSIKAKEKNISYPNDALFKENDSHNLKDNQANESFIDKVLIKYTKIKAQRSKRNDVKDKRTKRRSSERYDVLFPTNEEVLDSIYKMRSEADALDAYEKEYDYLNDSIPLVLKNLNHTLDPPDQNLLDCKHLTIDKLQDYFRRNLDFLASILNGESKSERHERFQNYDPRNYLTVRDLTYSSSIVVFSGSQRDVLFKLLEDHFDPESERTEYLFKVLLPDICLKIFMDVYEKTTEEAINYLDWRPLD